MPWPLVARVCVMVCEGEITREIGDVIIRSAANDDPPTMSTITDEAFDEFVETLNAAAERRAIREGREFTPLENHRG